jgi:hypothetical protein
MMCSTAEPPTHLLEDVEGQGTNGTQSNDRKPTARHMLTMNRERSSTPLSCAFHVASKMWHGKWRREERERWQHRA